MSNFMEKCIAGDVLPDEIDDFIETWHGGGSGLPLHEFLGMKEPEYSLWVENEQYLPFIIAAHKQNRTVESLLQEPANNLAMAARSGINGVEKLVEWLKIRQFL